MPVRNRLLVCCLLAASAACTGARAVEPPSPFRGELSSEGRRGLRVMTFNIHSCSAGYEKIVETIAGAHPDVVALQEVDLGTRRSEGQDQVRDLAERLGYPFYAHIPATTMKGGAYGMGILSLHPIAGIDTWPLPVPRGMEPRVVARAVIRLGERSISVWKTHLSPMPMWSSLRTEQVIRVLRLMEGDPRPKVLLGDMNDVASSKPIKLLLGQMQDSWLEAGSGAAGTYPLPMPLSPTLRYDYVLASKEWRIHRAFVIRSDASDHYPVVADLELPPSTEMASTDATNRAVNARLE